MRTYEGKRRQGAEREGEERGGGQRTRKGSHLDEDALDELDLKRKG